MKLLLFLEIWNMSKTTKPLLSDPNAVEILKEGIRQQLTDKQIQTQLQEKCDYEWNVVTIRRNRRKLGIKKGPGDQFLKEEQDQPALSIPPPGLTEREKADWFRSQFKKTHLFSNIKKQLTKEEIVVYLEEYGSLCCQFEDIVCSEFFQIDEALKHRILINRQLISISRMRHDIPILEDWIRDNKPDEETSKDARQEFVGAVQLLGDTRKSLANANKRYDELMKEEQNLFKNLSATRKDRIDQLSGGKENFFHLVLLLQHSEKVREEQGRYAELTKLSADQALEKARQPVEFPDGEMDTIVTDYQTVQEENSDET
jgi:hypothetical protein